MQSGLQEDARKLLSFTDNRQDASLQAGHFNDFIETTLLRSAFYQAVSQVGTAGIGHDELTLRVFEAIKLPLHLYANNPEVVSGTTRYRAGAQRSDRLSALPRPPAGLAHHIAEP